MKLVLLSPLPPQRTGIADYAQHWRQAVASCGVQVQAPLGTEDHFSSLAEARDWVRRTDWRGIDVVHAELGGGRQREFLALSALAELKDGRRPRLSATVHDPERLVWRPVHPLWHALDGVARMPGAMKKGLALLADPHTLRAERALAARLDGVVTLTSTGRTHLVRRMQLAPEKVRTIPHGILDLPSAPLPDLGVIRFLYFGFIYAGKGLEDLIEAMVLLRQRAPFLASQARQARLTIAGGTAPDIAFGGRRSYLEELRERVAAAGLQDQIDWQLDVEERDIPALIQRHHVMVLPYRESRKLSWLGQMRGTSGALAWATACGRGAITSNARAFAEEIGHGNGLAYPQGQVNPLADALAVAVRDPQRAVDWAQAAQRLAGQRHWASTGVAFRRYFESLVADRVAGPASTGVFEAPAAWAGER